MHLSPLSAPATRTHEAAGGPIGTAYAKCAGKDRPFTFYMPRMGETSVEPTLGAPDPKVFGRAFAQISTRVYFVQITAAPQRAS